MGGIVMLQGRDNLLRQDCITCMIIPDQCSGESTSCASAGLAQHDEAWGMQLSAGWPTPCSAEPAQQHRAPTCQGSCA